MRATLPRLFMGGAGAVLLAVAVYLLTWPVPAEPVPWPVSPPPGYTGPYAVNTRLADLRSINTGGEFGPEHMAVGPDGRLCAAMTGGNLLRMAPDGTGQQVFANTGGRVLGFDFDAQGRMIVADAMKGLLAIDPDGRVQLLANRVGAGNPIRYANAVTVAPDGTVYFTDASGRFAPAEWGGTLEASVLDILEQAATGRVLAYDPASASTRVVARGLSFANGIALSSDGQTLFVAETGRYRVWRIDSDARDVDVGASSPKARVWLDNLPGYPDNLMRGRDGRIWVGLFKPRNPAADGLAGKPFLRKLLLRLPRFLLPLGHPMAMCSPSMKAGRSPRTCRTPAAPIPRPRAPPRQRTGSTSTAFTPSRLAGCRDESPSVPSAPISPLESMRRHT